MLRSLPRIKNNRSLLPACAKQQCTDRHIPKIQTVETSFKLYKRLEQPDSNLILMHGLTGSTLNWRDFCTTLSPHVNTNIYVVDARNHGDSIHTLEHNYEVMAADLKEFIKKHDLHHVVVMGHSMGARTAMEVSLRYPELISGVIIEDMSPVFFPPAFMTLDHILLAMLRTEFQDDLSIAQARSILYKQLLSCCNVPSKVMFILQNLRRKPTGELGWACNVANLLVNFKHVIAPVPRDLPPYNGPVLFICGNKSPFMNVEHWPAIQEIYPNSELRWLDASHFVHFEQPVSFRLLVEEFLKQPSITGSLKLKNVSH